MQLVWENIKNYYLTLGKNYHVNPIIFLAIHIIATPLFVLSVAWLVRSYRKKKDIIFPALAAVFIFNAANIYLVLFGKNIPWWVYAVLAVTTIISSYFAYKKIRKKMQDTPGA